MNWETVTFVRIYLTEADKTLTPLLKKLHDQEKVRGVTVFRAMSGFGGSGVIHTASLVDLSLDLPVTVEFFDSPDKVDAYPRASVRTCWKADILCAGRRK